MQFLRMRNGATYATAGLLLVLLVAGCTNPNGSGAETVTDDLGRVLTVSLPAERVATLAPSLTEIVYAVGAGDRLVGVGMPDTYPPAVDTLRRFSTYPVDFEALAALEPRLVLATDQINSPRTAETLEAIGIATYFLSFRSLEDVLEGMVTVGRLLGTDHQARSAVDSLRTAIAALAERTARVAERPRVLFLIGHETLFSFGDESYVHELIHLAGGRSITEEFKTAAPVLSEEYVLSRAPDVIMGTWGDDVDPSDLLANHPAWDVVPAVRNGRVYGVPADLVERPGPRLVAGAYEMAARLHPRLFPDSSRDRSD